jgi:hypothetical protein
MHTLAMTPFAQVVVGLCVVLFSVGLCLTVGWRITLVLAALADDVSDRRSRPERKHGWKA